MGEAVGYAVLQLRIETLEREIKDIKNEMKEQSKDNIKEFNDLNDRVDDLATSQGRVEIMFTHVTQRLDKMDKSIETIAESAGKDQGWRALITDIIKLVILIISFIITGKLIL